jgi:MoxR-like ATPase
LPQAEVVFLDEVFKANAAILNSLLSLINERLFYNAGQPWSVRLVMLYAASNEPPQEEELGAFYDLTLCFFLAPPETLARLTPETPPPTRDRPGVKDLVRRVRLGVWPDRVEVVGGEGLRQCLHARFESCSEQEFRARLLEDLLGRPRRQRGRDDFRLDL